MIRQVIKIDEELCNGCGLCANTCHEGAIEIINGKAKLVREDHCDGLGNCLSGCPNGAISFEHREIRSSNEEEADSSQGNKADPPIAGCPGRSAREIGREHSEKKAIPIKPVSPCASGGCPGSSAKAIARKDETKVRRNDTPDTKPESELMQWPVQIKLVPTNASYFNNAKLLIAADCSAYAYADFHRDFIKNHITLIGCPKLDATDYSEKLAEIIRRNEIKSITVVRMEVPCCTGIEIAVKEAIIRSGKMIPWQIKVISVNGNIID